MLRLTDPIRECGLDLLAGGPSFEIRYVPDSAHCIGTTPKLARGPIYAAGCPTLCIVRVGGPVHIPQRDGQARENTRA
jgi:hypothetical protein